MGRLTAVAVKAALTNPGTHSDGGGLILKVDKRGGAYWLCRLWTVPADHMKRGKAPMLPLSEATLAVLAKAAALKLAGTDVVFPGAGGKPMSDMTLLKVLRDMSEPFHVHGFRSALTDWAANDGFTDAVVELHWRTRRAMRCRPPIAEPPIWGQWNNRARE